LLIGNALQLLREPLAFPVRCAREFGDVVRLRFGRMVVYLLNHPEAIEHVLRGNHRNFIKDRGTRLRSAVLGQGLLTSEAERWRRQRRLAQPAFQHDSVQRYGEVMVALTQRMLGEWRPGQLRDVHADLARLTLEIAAQTLCGASLAGQADQVARSLDAIMSYFAGPAAFFPWLGWLPTPGNRRFRRAVRELNAILSATLARRRAGGAHGDDLLARLLTAHDEEGGLTDQELRDELITLLLAGHETTALAVSFCLYLLGQHPQADARLAAELADVLQGWPPTSADVGRLRYAEWVLRESLRLYPPAPSIGREALSDCEVAGYFVPKGTQLALVQWVVQRDPRWFDEPETFKPQRWDNDLARRLPRCAYFPFGDGPRVCIGNHFALLEGVLILATICQRYRLTPAPGFTLQLLPSITLRPRGGVRMVLTERVALRPTV
jgi:cytochrome P450